MMVETDRSHTEDTNLRIGHRRGAMVANGIIRPIRLFCHRKSREGKGNSGAEIVSLACSARSETQTGDRVARTSMNDQQSFLSGDPHSRRQAAEHMLNSAITQAKISESFEEYLEIFDKFYADEVEVGSDTQQEPIRGKARVGSLLLNFLVPLHVMVEIGGLAISIKETT